MEYYEASQRSHLYRYYFSNKHTQPDYKHTPPQRKKKSEKKGLAVGWYIG